MPSTKSQKVVKAADSEDETRTFYRKQKNMQKAVSHTARSSLHVSHAETCVVIRHNPFGLTTSALKVKTRQNEARSRINRNRANRNKDLKTRIDYLKRGSSVKQ